MTSLPSSVHSLRSSLALLSSTTSILDTGVSDFPRLRKVLSTQSHFELLSEPTLRAAQQSLLDEITPAISQLLNTAENHVNQLGRREEGLRAKSELLEVRLGNSERKRGSSLSNAGAGKFKPGVGGDAKMMEEMKRLRLKKERLQYAVERLEMQSKQRERELRKSMAVVKD